MTSAEARYLRASRNAHRAWAESQPQYVIPGVLSDSPAVALLGCALDETQEAPGGADGTLRLVERATPQPPSQGCALQSCDAEPRSRVSPPGDTAGRTRPPLPGSAGASASHHNNNDGPGRRDLAGTLRGRGQNGA